MIGLLIEDESSLGGCVAWVVLVLGADEVSTVGEEDAEGFGDGITEGAIVGALVVGALVGELVGELAVAPTNVSPRNGSDSPKFSRVSS
jgi:hypothetical protein